VLVTHIEEVSCLGRLHEIPDEEINIDIPHPWDDVLDVARCGYVCDKVWQ